MKKGRSTKYKVDCVKRKAQPKKLEMDCTIKKDQILDYIALYKSILGFQF